MLVTLYKLGEVHFRLLGTNGVHVKTKNEGFTAVGSRCRQNLKCEKFHVVVWQTASKNCTEKRAARAARLPWFSFNQPIKSLICGVFVAVTVAVVMVIS